MKWPMVKLRDVVTLINGRAYKKNEMLREGKYPLMRVGNFFSNRDWYYSDLELPEKQYCDKGDLIYAWSASFGPQIWQGGKVIYHYHIWKLIVDESLADKKYLFYALKRDVDFIKAEQGSGSTMVHVTKTAMENREIPLPPLEEQKRIATILDKADAIRCKRQQAIDLADVFLRSVFLDMFGDPITNPKGWKQGGFSDISAINPKAEKYDDKLPVSFVAMSNVSEDSHVLDASDIRVYSDVKKGFTAFKEGDVLFAKITPCMENGKAAIATGLKNGIGFGSTEFHVFRLDNTSYAPFIYSLIHLPIFRKVSASNFSGAVGHKRVPKDFLSNFKLILPPIELVLKFKNVFEAVNESKTKFSANTFESSELFHSLSQKAFAGEL
ncbi:restriction endonuclease subunit S [Marinomonas dokdonensis]|uniref:restriction endonuclease subunit S n=1 Tax=Marinomonas dokdonensis TaxID=328224 RepID=UPI004055982B